MMALKDLKVATRLEGECFIVRLQDECRCSSTMHQKLMLPGREWRTPVSDALILEDTLGVPAAYHLEVFMCQSKKEEHLPYTRQLQVLAFHQTGENSNSIAIT